MSVSDDNWHEQQRQHSETDAVRASVFSYWLCEEQRRGGAWYDGQGVEAIFRSSGTRRLSSSPQVQPHPGALWTVARFQSRRKYLRLR